jgi:hypothetical protein
LHNDGTDHRLSIEQLLLIAAAHQVVSGASALLMFFTLPPELRLQVYRELLITCLTESRGSHLKGLFFSCRQILQEAESECVGDARPLLETMCDWKRNHQQARPLYFQFADQGSSAEPLQISALFIPSTSFSRTFNTESKGTKQDRLMIRSLRRVFRLPHSTLKIHVAVSEGNVWLPVMMLLFGLVNGLSVLHDGLLAFGETERLMFHLQTNRVEPRWTMDKLSRKINTSPAFGNVEGSWVAKEAADGSVVTWLFGFDFKPGLPEVLGTIFQNGVWRA